MDGHSPYLKAVLAAGYEQHLAREARCGPIDAPIVENAEQDIGGWGYNMAKAAKNRLSLYKDGAEQAADYEKERAMMAAPEARRRMTKKMDRLHTKIAKLTSGSDEYEYEQKQKQKQLYALLLAAEAM